MQYRKPQMAYCDLEEEADVITTSLGNGGNHNEGDGDGDFEWPEDWF